MPNASDKIWYVRKGIKKLGPFNNAEMRGLASSGRLVPEDMIWKDGLDGWVKASKLKGVFPVQPQIQEVSPPPIEPETEVSNQQSDNPSVSILLITTVIGLIVAILGGGLLISAGQKKSSTLDNSSNSTSTEKKEIPTGSSATRVVETKSALPTEPKSEPLILSPDSKVEEKLVESADSYKETLGYRARERLLKVPPMHDIELAQTQDVIEFSEREYTKNYNGPFLNKVIKINDSEISSYDLYRNSKEGLFVMKFKVGIEEATIGNIIELYRIDNQLSFCADTEDALWLQRSIELWSKSYKSRKMYCDLYFKIVNRESKTFKGLNFPVAKLVWATNYRSVLSVD